VPKATYNPDRDLDEAAAMVEGLGDYVRGNALYGSTGGGGVFSSNMPSLTVGALLLRLRRLRALEDKLTPAQRERLSQTEHTHADVRREWRLHYTEKLTQEALSRLKAMEIFFEECNESPRSCAANYPPEAMRRTIVQEIIGAMQALDVPLKDVNVEAHKVDGRLRRFTTPGNFIWAETLEQAYPRSEFWWLYAAPPDATKK
jgi:hypothetical protein